MQHRLEKALNTAVLRLLRPLVRVLLRNGVPFGAFSDLAKAVYVDIAARDFPIAGRKQSISRVSVLTGLSRKEVLRVQRLGTPEDHTIADRYNRAARTISGWVRDRDFADVTGAPSALPIDGATASFSALVKRYGGDVPMRAVLDELLRVGALERLEDGRVHLLTRAYVPGTGEEEKLDILGRDVAELISTIDHNLREDRPYPLFQRKASYDNLPQETLPDLRALIARRGQELLEELDDWMAAHDRDLNPSVAGTGRKRASIGVYYFEGDVSLENPHETD